MDIRALRFLWTLTMYYLFAAPVEPAANKFHKWHDVLRPGDVLLRPLDLARPRHILLQPGTRVFLIDEIPTYTSSENSATAPSTPIHKETEIPAGQYGVFTFSWLPNVTFTSTSLAELIRSSGTGVKNMEIQRGLEEIMDLALIDTTGGLAALEYSYKIMSFIEAALAGFCTDSIDIFGGEQEDLMHAILEALTSKVERIRWLVRYMFRGGYLTGDELCLNAGSRAGDLELRLHLWHDFRSLYQDFAFTSGVHEHGSSVFVSRQLAGTVEHRVYLNGGAPFDEQHFYPYILQSNEERLNLSTVQMQGIATRLEANMSYTFPPRWVHAVRSVTPSGTLAMSFEIRVFSQSNDCSVAPLRVRAKDAPSPSKLKQRFSQLYDEIRNGVARVLASGLHDSYEYQNFISKVEKAFRQKDAKEHAGISTGPGRIEVMSRDAEL